MPLRASKRRFAVLVGALAAATAVVGCRAEPKKRAKAPAMPSAPLPSAVPAALKAPEMKEVTFQSRGHTLYGWVTKPTGPGPFPVFIFNHGSERDVHPFRSMRDFFVGKGFVFFVPLRSGHGKSQGQYVPDEIHASKGDKGAAGRLLEAQVEDVASAGRFIAAQPYVNRQKIIVGGGSFGGIETLFAAERGFDFRAAVDWGGDAESWNNTVLRRRLMRAVDNAKIPIFFLQAENDHTTEPTRVFGAEATRANKPHKAKIYPAWGNPSDHHDGHAGFTCKGSATWGADVLAFIAQYAK